MIDFFLICAISVAALGVTSLLAYEIMGWTWTRLVHLAMPPRLRVLLMLGPIFTVHVLGIWIYAVAYLVLENFTSLGAISGVGHVVDFSRASFMDCLYFSSTTYTSLGLGDLVLKGSLRMLGMTEALNGLILIGWTVSFTYLAMSRFWNRPDKDRAE